jgi:hypothetical protein
MSLILRLFERIAASPKMAPIIANTVIATMTVQSTTDRAIDAATQRNGRIFAAYIVILLVTAVLIAVFTWLTWDSGNKLQDAIRQDANARIGEASHGVEALKQDNLKLGGDLEKEKGKVAGLQKDASDAKAAQQKVEISLAQQKERAAIAEADLAKLKDRIAPRKISESQKEKVASLLKQFSEQEVELRIYGLEIETREYGQNIENALIKARLKVRGTVMADGIGTGFAIVVHDEKNIPLLATGILLAFNRAGVPMDVLAKPELVEIGNFFILVGAKSAVL